MSPIIKVTLLAAMVSSSVFAADKDLELLAGIEAGVESNTAMTETDLEKTQNILSTYKTGAQETWYNLDTTTHYKLKVGQKFNYELRPCVSYELQTRHASNTEDKNLKACMNYDGNWISMTDSSM